MLKPWIGATRMGEVSSKLLCRLGPVTLPSPILAASGTAGYGTEGFGYMMRDVVGAIVTKGLSLDPKKGNPPPRIAETPCGMLNSIGLQNIGLEAFLKEHMPTIRKEGTRVVVNLLGEREEEYLEGVARLAEEGDIVAVELNVSCPNVRKGGLAFGKDPEVIYRLVKKAKSHSSTPLWVKIPPDGTNFVEVAQAAWEAGSDAITVANTYVGMAVDVEKKRPKLSTGTGGLSGPAIRPLTLYRVWRIARRAPVPVIASGGIGSARDALEYIIAGASAVQVGSASFANPMVYLEIARGLEAYLSRHGHRELGEIVGSLRGMPEDSV